MREAIESHVGPNRMLGTFHAPCASNTRQGLPVLILNPGHVGRAGAGDLLARMGDELATQGHPVFRFDFPGLGDSPGELPDWEVEYFRFIQEGGNTDMALGLIEEVSRRTKKAEIVLIGLCGGAITAILAADRTSAFIRQIVLLDSDYSLISQGPPGKQGKGLAQGGHWEYIQQFAKKIRHPRTWLRFFTGENRFARILRPLRGILLPIAKRVLGNKLPSDANLALINACRRVISQGTLILSITAAGKLRELYAQQVEPVAFELATKDQIERVSISDTNHVFTAGGAKSLVIQEITRWLGMYGTENT